MVALRYRPKGGVMTSFGLCTLAFALVPASVGPQDLMSLIRPPGRRSGDRSRR